MRSAAVFAVGATAQLVQIAVIQELAPVADGSELSAALLIAAWMGCCSLGGVAGGRVAARWFPRGACVVWTALALLLSVTGVCVARFGRTALGVAPGTMPSLTQLCGLALASAGPASFAMGALFPLAVRWTGPRNGEVGQSGDVYAWESLGAGAMGILYASLLAARFSVLSSTCWVGGTLILLFAVAPDARGGGSSRRWVLALFSGIVVLTGLLVEPVDRWLRAASWRAAGHGGYELRSSQFSAAGRISAVEYAEQIGVYRGGRLAFCLPDTGESAPLVHAILVQSPAPRRVLMVGGAYSGCLKHVLHHPVQRVVCIESTQVLGQICQPFLGPVDRAALRDPRVEMVTGDGRAWIRGTAQTFDVVVVLAGEPTTFAANRFFTREFFGEVSGCLASDGIVALGPVTGHSAYADRVLLRRNRILLKTASDTFASVLPVGEGALLFLASLQRERSGRWVTDSAAANAILAQRGIPVVDFSYLLDRSGVERVGYELRTGEPYNPLTAMDRGASHGDWAGLPANTDRHPVACLATMRIWSEVENDRLGAAVARLGEVDVLVWTAGIAVLAAGTVLAGRARGKVSAVPLLGATFALGFWGAGSLWLIMAGFQSGLGVLHQWIGALIGAFMVGLAGGAGWGRRLAPRRTLLAGVLIAAAFLPLASGGFCTPGWRGGGPLVGVFYGVQALACGGGVGVAFAAVVGLVRERGDAAGEVRTGGLVYGLDVLGGLCGIVLIATVVAPGQGFAAAATLLSTVCLAAAAVVSAGEGSATSIGYRGLPATTVK